MQPFSAGGNATHHRHSNNMIGRLVHAIKNKDFPLSIKKKGQFEKGYAIEKQAMINSKYQGASVTATGLWECFSIEIWMHIVRYMPMSDLLSMCLVSKNLCEIVSLRLEKYSLVSREIAKVLHKGNGNAFYPQNYNPLADILVKIRGLICTFEFRDNIDLPQLLNFLVKRYNPVSRSISRSIKSDTANPQGYLYTMRDLKLIEPHFFEKLKNQKWHADFMTSHLAIAELCRKQPFDFDGFCKIDALYLYGGPVGLHTLSGDYKKILYRFHANIVMQKFKALLQLSNAQSLLDYIREKLDEGISINIQDSKGKTFLHYLVSHAMGGQRGMVDDKEIVLSKYLLKLGAHPDIQDEKGETALHCAVSFGERRVIQCLMDNGASFNVQDHTGKLAYSY